MANLEHVAIVKQGTDVLNDWRGEHPGVKLDLRKANLSEVNLRAADLSYADIRNANLKEANLSYAYLSYADLSYANLREVNFSYANLNATDLSYTNLISTKFISANLNSAKLISAKLISADLNMAHLRSAYLRSANLISANLTSANLSCAELIFASLMAAKLVGADLTSADLRSAKFNAADLSAANLSHTHALYTNFERATLTGACIKDWRIDRQTKLHHTNTEYIFLDINENKNTYAKRHPSSGMFDSDDFVKLVQQSTSTVDLIFRNGINWQAFLYAFQCLQNKAKTVKLDIQSIENQDDGMFVIRVNTPPNASHTKIQTFVMNEYKKALQAIASQYMTTVNDNDANRQAYREQLKLQHRNNIDLRSIVKIMAEQDASKRDLHKVKRASAGVETDHRLKVKEPHYSAHEGNGHKGNSHKGNSHKGNSHKGNSHKGNSHEGNSHKGNSHEGNDHESNHHQSNGHESNGHADRGRKGHNREGYSRESYSREGKVQAGNGNVNHAHQAIDAPQQEQEQEIVNAITTMQTLLKRLAKIKPAASAAYQKAFVSAAIKPAHKQCLVDVLHSRGSTAIQELLDRSYKRVGLAIINSWKNG